MSPEPRTHWLGERTAKLAACGQRLVAGVLTTEDHALADCGACRRTVRWRRARDAAKNDAARAAAAGATLVVNQIFSAWQGEGPSAGRLATFIRLMGCNLSCSWCDEPQTWDAKRFTLADQGKRLTGGQIAAYVEHPMVVVTGGEPLLHQTQAAWPALLDGLRRTSERIEVETNGTIMPDRLVFDGVDGFNVSPKLANSGLAWSQRISFPTLARFADHPGAVFKFVCTGTGDLTEVTSIARGAGIRPGQVWIMPEGTTPGPLLERARALAPATERLGYNLTLRQHVLLYPEGEPR